VWANDADPTACLAFRPTGPNLAAAACPTFRCGFSTLTAQKLLADCLIREGTLSSWSISMPFGLPECPCCPWPSIAVSFRRSAYCGQQRCRSPTGHEPARAIRLLGCCRRAHPASLGVGPAACSLG